MPFNEALFWVGLTMFGTGIYFLREKGLKDSWSVVMTIIGSVAVIYSVYRHYHPELPSVPLWVSLLIFTWAFLAYDIYDRRKGAERAPLQQRDEIGHDPNPNQLSNSPRLIVTCTKDKMRINNDGPNGATNIEIGPLIHEERHTIEVLYSPFPSIPSKHTEERVIVVSQRQPNVGGTLWQAIRATWMEPDPADSITVKFDDLNGTEFSQNFVLGANADGSVTCIPGPVRTR